MDENMIRNKLFLIASFLLCFSPNLYGYEVDLRSKGLGILNITEEQLKLSQQYSRENIKQEALMHGYGITFSSYEWFQKFLLKYPLNNSEIRMLRKKAKKNPNSSYFLPFDKQVFALNIPSLKEDFYQGIISASVQWAKIKNLKISIKLNKNDSFYNLASKFLFGRTIDCVESIIREKGSEKEGYITINIRELFPDFLKENLYNFSTEHGPNCISNALCTLQPKNKYVDYYIDPSRALFNLYLKDYRILKASEELESGDYLLYFKDTTPWHAASYIMKTDDKEVVFTKNGYLASSPRVLQYKAYMEYDVYDAKNIKLNLIAFRKSTYKDSITYKQTKMKIDKLISIYSRPLSNRI